MKFSICGLLTTQWSWQWDPTFFHIGDKWLSTNWELGSCTCFQDFPFDVICAINLDIRWYKFIFILNKSKAFQSEEEECFYQNVV